MEDAYSNDRTLLFQKLKKKNRNSNMLLANTVLSFELLDGPH